MSIHKGFFEVSDIPVLTSVCECCVGAAAWKEKMQEKASERRKTHSKQTVAENIN